MRRLVDSTNAAPSPLTLDKCPHCGSQLRSGTRHFTLRLPGERYVGTEAILVVHGGNRTGLCFRSRVVPSRLGNLRLASCLSARANKEEESMGGLIYLVGLIVIILFILSFLGLR
jgi:hypothetical protein